MKYTNSPLVVYTKLSPNHSGQRIHTIDRISPHCVVGQCTVESLGDWFAKSSTQASSNYGIDKNGRVGLYVEEKNRSWCTSSNANDQRAITIECASGVSEPYEMYDVVYERLIDLCTDICKRNGKTKLLWFGDKDKSLNYNPKSDEMVITVHRWYANKSCPGDWLYSRLGDLASKVTARLGDKEETKEETVSDVLYRVQTGAFSNKDYADALEKKLKAKGYDTYMVKSGGLYKVQVGAYSKKSNADAMAAKLEADGFDTYITTKSGTAVIGAITKKSNAEIAKEIYTGTCSDSRWTTWGNGQTRVERLKAAGYDPSAVQNEVNKLF